jgi:plastocyanin
MRILWILALVVVLGGGFWYYSSMTPSSNTSSVTAPLDAAKDVKNQVEQKAADSMAADTMTPGSTPDPKLVGGDAMAPKETPGKKSFTIIGGSFFYDIKEMKVKKGDVVTVTFRNNEGKHDIRFDDFNAATKVIMAGQEETITFTANKVGEFEYYCSVGNHRAMGQKGKLIVTE